MELLLTGERIDAERAKEIGLAGWVVPHDELMAEARPGRPTGRAAPLAARAMKEVAVALAAPAVARSHPLRRDHAQGGGGHRGRRRGQVGPRGSAGRRSGKLAEPDRIDACALISVNTPQAIDLRPLTMAW